MISFLMKARAFFLSLLAYFVRVLASLAAATALSLAFFLSASLPVALAAFFAS